MPASSEDSGVSIVVAWQGIGRWHDVASAPTASCERAFSVGGVDGGEAYSAKGELGHLELPSRYLVLA